MEAEETLAASLKNSRSMIFQETVRKMAAHGWKKTLFSQQKTRITPQQKCSELIINDILFSSRQAVVRKEK